MPSKAPSKPTAARLPVTRIRVPKPPATHPRRSLRLPIPGVLVAVEAPSVARKPWVVGGLDLSADGMGMMMPAGLPPDTEVRLSFQLADGTSFSRVPARVLHLQGGSGGVKFLAWTERERLTLLEYLVRSYEGD